MKKIRFALVGCGRISSKHYIPLRNHKRAEISLICDKKKKRITEYEELDKQIPSTLKYDDVITNDSIDIIDLCTPSGLHPDMAIAAAKKGKHVLCEKPLALSYKDALKVVQCFKKNNVSLGIVFQNRLNPPIKYLKDKLTKGVLGKIQLITATVRWYRPDSYYHDEWHGKKVMDGGILFNQATHYVDMLLYLANKKVKSVYCKSATLGHKIEIDDAAILFLKFTDNTLGIIEASTLSYPQNMEGSVTLQCKNGTVKIGGKALDVIEYWEGAGKPQDFNKYRCSRKDNSVYGNSHDHIIDNMINHLSRKEKLVCSGSDALYAIKVIDAAYKSAKLGREVKVQ